jgi:hypothetical protein
METTFPARGTLAPSILSSLPSGRTRALSLSRSLSPFTTSLLPTLCRSQSIPYTLSRALILSRSGAGFSPLFSSLRRPGKRKRLGMTASENQASQKVFMCTRQCSECRFHCIFIASRDNEFNDFLCPPEILFPLYRVNLFYFFCEFKALRNCVICKHFYFRLSIQAEFIPFVIPTMI